MSSYGQTSGTTSYSPFAQDLVIDAFGRCGVLKLENKHYNSARRSLSLLLNSSWSNKGANLWKIEEVTIPLIPGAIEYFLTRDTVTVLDCFRRQYQMNGPQNYAVQFSTQINTPNVTIQIAGNSSPVGSYVGIAIPVSVGGLVLYGFYQVIATPTVNSITIQAGTNATGTVSLGGAVPTFTSTASSQSVTVTLANHGYLPGASFPVNVAVTVGDISLSGNYVIQSVTNANQFVILASSDANSNQTVSENGGQASISSQNIVAGYTDILMTQFSRTDYAAMSNKTAPGAPTTLWVDKQIIPRFSLWPVTDNTGPYEIHLWCMKQIQDVNPTGGQTLDVPPRMLYAATLDLARDLSMTYAPDRYTLLKTESGEAWDNAASTDVENTSTYFLPQIYGL